MKNLEGSEETLESSLELTCFQSCCLQRKYRPMESRENYQYAIMEITGSSLSLRCFGRLGSGLSVISMGMEFFIVVENVFNVVAIVFLT